MHRARLVSRTRDDTDHLEESGLIVLLMEFQSRVRITESFLPGAFFMLASSLPCLFRQGLWRLQVS